MKTKNLAVGILAAVLTVALWWTTLLKPMRAKASKVHDDIENEKSKLAPLQAQLDKARRDAAHAAEFKAELESLRLAMPDSPALAAFIRDANGIAQASGVTWQSVTHGAPTLGVGGMTSITIGIQIKGGYGEVVDYLSRLSDLQRLVVVDSVQLSTAGTTGAAAGGTETAGGSTGPFSGASELSAVISARMFASAAALDATAGTATATGTGASTPAATATGTASPVPPAGKTTALNNS